MTTVEMTKRTAEASPRLTARIAAVFYLLTFVTGGYAAVYTSRGLVAYANAANLIASACYIVVTLLFYVLFMAVNRNLSLLAAVVSLMGCLIGPLGFFRLAPFPINPLVFFGIYCLLIGYLIFRSTFLPRFLGALMALGGLGWLTFLWPTLAKALSPYIMLPGVLGEGSLTLWLLLAGVNVPRWKEQAGAILTRHAAGLA
ncbi:MAG TPA: DUF4386 domain-containing protein [Thermoanaerobaculia bacterium]|nr:DUF4386 domain-containing protein [Thermoanaerobaculia bacterium]